MFKKSSVFLLSIVLLFSSLGVAAASDVSSVKITKLSDGNDTASVKTVSVRDIVPEEYFASVEGKYQSKEEIQKAAGFENVKSEKISKMQFDNGAIIVNDLDEYAALLQYYSDLEKQQVNNNQRSFSPTAIVTDYTEQTIWGDGLAGGGANLSWITGIVQYERYDKSGNYALISVTDTDSLLKGFHPGNSWQHSSAKTTYGIDSGGRSGWAWIRGTRTLSIIWEGIGDIITRSEEYYMTF